MPSRPLLALILAGWLATTTYFCYREVWPHVRPGSPPPFTIELADETTIQHAGLTRWTISRITERGKVETLGRAFTWMTYEREDDTFTFHSDLKDVELLRDPLPITLRKQESATRVTRDGRLRSMYTTGRLNVLGFPVAMKVTAVVKPDGLHRVCELKAGDQSAEVTLPPIPVPEGSVLSPLQPVNKINGLTPGRHWRMPVIDPLGDAFKTALPELVQKMTKGRFGGGEVPKLALPEGPTTLAAEVRELTAELFWNTIPERCHVIDYRNGDFTAETWVRPRDGLVLRQEASLLGVRLRIDRD